MELQTIQEMRQRAEGVLSDVHVEFRADLKFYWGDQWNGQERERQLAGRQSVVFNNCPSLVHPVVNAVKQAPPAIRILPLGGGATQEKAARVAARIRMIERECKASKARLYALTCAAIGGIGVWRSIPKKVRGKWTTWSETIIDPTDVLPDASSMEPDFSDARWVLHKRKVHKSRLAGVYNASELAAQYEFNKDRAAYSDEMETVIECWYLDAGGTLCRCVATSTEVLGFRDGEDGEVQKVERFDGLTELPYNFVTGDFYQDEGGVRHYSSLTRYAKADQIAINYAENEWISDIVMTPKTQFIAEADAVEDFEDDWTTAHTKARPFLKVKSLDGKIRDFAPPDKSARFLSFSQSHRQSMTTVTGVAPTQGPVMDPVSGKSVKLQQSQAAVSSYHYVDSLNAAIEHDGRVYLDQMRVYENDDTVRASLGEDGTTVTQVSFGPGMVEGAENIDLEGSEFGVAVSTGPSYGSQLEQVQDMVTDLCSRVPALAPILLPLVVRRMAIPESEDVIQALTLSLPPNVQAMLADKGDKGAQLAQAVNQAQQAGQMVQQLQEQLQQVMGALKQSQEALATRGAIQERDNETKRQIAEIQAQNDRIIKQMDKDLSLRNDLILQGAKAQDAEELQAQNAGHTIITGFAGRMGTPAPVRPFDHT
jgi:hypothetical protein